MLHQYNTRTRKNNSLININIKHEFAKKSIQYNIVQETNAAPDAFKSKTLTHSFTGFAKYIKIIMINNYHEACLIMNCYTCSNHNS